jgi:S-methylmethionine-dependent homocysteine/selenocysteine methylase
MPSRSIIDRLKAGEILLLDGGTGTELHRRGVTISKGAVRKQRTTARSPIQPVIAGSLGVWSAAANLEAPDVVKQIHEDYLKLGCDIIISNNFYTSKSMMATIGKGDQWEEYTRRGGELAVEVRNALNPEAYVAGGFAPTEYDGDLREELEATARILAGTGVDFLIAEYFGGDTTHDTPIKDCVTAVDALAKANLPVFLGVCCLNENGSMYRGESLTDLVAALKGHPVDGIFLMCSRPGAISVGMPELRKAFGGFVGAYAEIGYEENPKFGSSPKEEFFTIDTKFCPPEKYAEYAREWKKMGAQIIGACCASTPEHIKAIAPIVKGE